MGFVGQDWAWANCDPPSKLNIAKTDDRTATNGLPLRILNLLFKTTYSPILALIADFNQHK
jgi:hypothetical protein